VMRLAADDGDESLARSRSMLSEMCRLLSPPLKQEEAAVAGPSCGGGGVLCIVSLLQPFVLRSLLGHFAGQRQGWCIEFQIVEPMHGKPQHPRFKIPKPETFPGRLARMKDVM
jgi:hypothetical protein